MLSLRDVSYYGTLPLLYGKSWHPTILPINCDLEQGKIYRITADGERNLWMFCYILTGYLNPQRGYFWMDGVELFAFQRRKLTWFVRYSEIQRFGLFYQSVKRQIRHGIKKYNAHNLTEADYMRIFRLDIHRFNRRLRYQSTQAWRSSCAIGLANNRKIICFSPVISGHILEEYHNSWFGDMLKFMKSLNCTILLPLSPYANAYNLHDETIHI